MWRKRGAQNFVAIFDSREEALSAKKKSIRFKGNLLKFRILGPTKPPAERPTGNAKSK